MSTPAYYAPAPVEPRCPDCQAPIAGSTSCPQCGLSLVGPTAARLWQVDQQLLAMTAQQDTLLRERGRLLALLRSGGEEPLPTGPPPMPAGPPQWRPVSQRREASPRSVQNTLLGLGGLLLAGAGLVFAAVTYDHLGVVGRAMVLLVLTGLAAGAPMLLLKKGLSASAETFTVVALVLSCLDAWALRRAGFAADVDAWSYTAVATALLALAAGGYAQQVRVRAAWIGCALLAQLPVLCVLARVDADFPSVAVSLAALGAVDAWIAAEKGVPQQVRAVTSVSAALALMGAVGASLAAVEDDNPGGALGLLAVAVVLAGASTRLIDPVARAFASGAVVPLVAGAAVAVARTELTDKQLPLVGVAVALLALQVTGLLPGARRLGPALGALVVAGVTLLIEAEYALVALVGPLSWLTDAWSGTATQARDLVGPDIRWTGTVVTLVVLAGAAACTVGAGLVLDRLRQSLVPAGALLVLSAVVLPLGLATTFTTALALLLLVAALLSGAGIALLSRAREAGLALVVSGGTAALLAAVWSTAKEDTTLTVLPIVALLAVGIAVFLPGLPTGAALVLAGAELAAIGASRGLEADQIGGLLLLAPAAAVALSLVLKGSHRVGLEIAAVILGATAVLLAVDDAGWLSWTLAGTGVLAAVVAVRPDRRNTAYAGGLLLSASSWVRLLDAEVTAPEPYVLPLAFVALALGHLRRRQQPQTSSFSAYGAGLTLALVPSLLAALGDDTPLRGLLLLPAAALVVVAGVQERLRAPLVIGGSVLVIDALNLLAPYAEALPRWTLLALVGGTLVALGATYEQRRQDVARLRERYDALN